jgi:hypothetical protein
MGAAERGHGQRRAAELAGKETGEGEGEGERKKLTCGPRLAEGERERGESARAGPREEKEREKGRGRWAAGRKGRPKGRRGSWLGYLL